MASKYEESDLSKIRPVSIETRDSKVRIEDFVDPDASQADGGLISGDRLAAIFPDVLKGGDLRKVCAALREARDGGRAILWLIGAHVIKCGLSLYVNSLMRKGYITAIATTGSATVHDLELAFYGKTSEDVAVELPQGRFGMSKETAEHFSQACVDASATESGLGEGLGEYINRLEAPNRRFSTFGEAQRASVPATVHVAMGTDITHQHPSFDGALVGDLTMRDFRIFTASVGNVFEKGVVVVFGSAVVLPEVFLKAVSINYNFGKKPRDVTAANFDMFQQYRVRENILARPFHEAGASYSFNGHHEIMLPLLYHLLVNE